VHSLVAGVIVGFVTASRSGEPLPFADVTMHPLGGRALADERGRFQWANAPAGSITLTVRRIGYAPQTVSLTVVDGRTDTVRVALTPISIRLDAVKTSEAQCSGRFSADPAVVTILQQVQLNADRYRLLTREYPFVTTMERTMADEAVSALAVGVRRQRYNARVDTIPLSHESARPYEPGKLVSRPAGGEAEIQGWLRIPTLADFADSAFVAVHCFRYAGVMSDADGRHIRVDFAPTPSFRESDVSGSLWMDPATFQITRSLLEMSLPPLLGAGSDWDIRVDTRFHEMWPGISILASVCGRTMLASNTQTARASGRVVRLGRSTVEEQRALDINFDRSSPDLGARTRAVPPRAVSCE
jgi:hypothetical protein